MSRSPHQVSTPGVSSTYNGDKTSKKIMAIPRQLQDIFFESSGQEETFATADENATDYFSKEHQGDSKGSNFRANKVIIPNRTIQTDYQVK